MSRQQIWKPDRRDIIWIDFNPHVGVEMKDIHPMLVLSNKAFNEKTGLVIGLPMTTASFNESNQFAVKTVWANGTVSYILASQPKSLDWRNRRARPHQLKKVPLDAFAQACAKLNYIVAAC
jgi:mRNA interferase MazF